MPVSLPGSNANMVFCFFLQVCGEKERRYCCPRCGKLTCSLPCYKRHKKEVRRNRERFV
ncbi:unnamed protein product, partial [Ectocarpus sp. 8 AP-2014]